MNSDIFANVVNNMPNYRKHTLTILFLGVYTALSLPLLYHSKQTIPFYTLLVIGAFLIVLTIMLFRKRTLNLSPILLLTLLLVLYSSAFTFPFTPFEILLLIPIYHLMIIRYRPVLFWVVASGYCLIALFFQSGIFIPHQIQTLDATLNYRWLFSVSTVIPLIGVLVSKTEKTYKSSDMNGELFQSLEAYVHAIDAVDIGLWSWDTINNIFNISRQCGKLLHIKLPTDRAIISIYGTHNFTQFTVMIESD